MRPKQSRLVTAGFFVGIQIFTRRIGGQFMSRRRSNLVDFGAKRTLPKVSLTETELPVHDLALTYG